MEGISSLSVPDFWKIWNNLRQTRSLLFERISGTPQVMFLTEYLTLQESCFWGNWKSIGNFRNHVFDKISQNFHGSLCLMFERSWKSLRDSKNHVLGRIQKNLEPPLWLIFERFEIISGNTGVYFLKEFETISETPQVMF